MKAEVKEVIRRAREQGVGPEDLDELVHSTASNIASGVNNNGLEEQIGFLVTHLGIQATAEAIEGGE